MHEEQFSPEQNQADLARLRLLQLVDSAFPIGALAHSFGMETLSAASRLEVPDVENFLRDYLEEAGAMEAVFCREGFRLAAAPVFCSVRWAEINERLGALKPGRESRAASAALGRNFLVAVASLHEPEVATEALQAANDARFAIHHAPAFGLVAGALGVEEQDALRAYLHQSAAALVSACQRLLPLGQSQATAILWNLNPAILESVRRSQSCAMEDACCFFPLLDWGAMEHVALPTRLFIS